MGGRVGWRPPTGPPHLTPRPCTLHPVPSQFAPSRHAFFAALRHDAGGDGGGGGNDDDAAVVREMQAFLAAFRPLLDEVDLFLKDNDLDDPTRV